MPSEAVSLFWTAESALHPGAGATLSAVDLPIQRETHTGNPIVYGSGLKGALRELKANASGKVAPEYEALFGPDSAQASDHAGLGIFSEARVVLFPVASFAGIFVWVTCPAELHRLKRDLLALEKSLDAPAAKAAKDFALLSIPDPGVSNVAAPKTCSAVINGKIFLLESEGLTLESAAEPAAAQIAKWFADHGFPAGPEYADWRSRANNNIVVLSNDEFYYFVKVATHIEMHVKIGPTGTVEDGPWSEESLPPDTLLHSTVVLPPPLAAGVLAKLNGQKPKKLLEDIFATHPRFQICGDQSVGKGWVCPRILS